VGPESTIFYFIEADAPVPSGRSPAAAGRDLVVLFSGQVTVAATYPDGSVWTATS
jgi:hypothetical protein